MWLRFKRLLPLCLVFLLAVSANPCSTFGQGVEGPQFGIRATEGDSVWVILNHVKAEKRAQFEEFMSFFIDYIEDLAAYGKLSERETRHMARLRYLVPTEASSETTFTYIFMADPWIGDVGATIQHYFRAKPTLMTRRRPTVRPSGTASHRHRSAS